MLDLENGILSVETESCEETFELGKRLGESAQPGEIYVLNGDLGTGKTVLSQGIAKGLGIEGPVNSPTFTILQVYEEGRIPLYHFAVYRIADPDEMYEIGFEDCFFGEGLSLVEWGELIRDLLPDHYFEITIEKETEKGFDYRRIMIRENIGD